ncbi:MAG: hypothetical protein HYV78_02455 [Candidatus Wildermuthbacteria bacterium]|nr:hypothetical protein [Candidatus Wildermuthbacteria bacterium]
MNKKAFLFFVGAAILLLAGGSWYYLKNKRPKNVVPPLQKQETGALGEDLYNQTANPGAKLPEVNPFQKTETNPFESSKTNPFEDVYKNPFSK